jgi:hypothetical protein
MFAANTLIYNRVIQPLFLKRALWAMVVLAGAILLLS